MKKKTHTHASFLPVLSYDSWHVLVMSFAYCRCFFLSSSPGAHAAPNASMPPEKQAFATRRRQMYKRTINPSKPPVGRKHVHTSCWLVWKAATFKERWSCCHCQTLKKNIKKIKKCDRLQFAICFTVRAYAEHITPPTTTTKRNYKNSQSLRWQRQDEKGSRKMALEQALPKWCKHEVKVARNEVENASFAQRSAHRDSRIWRPELIEPAAERKRRARGRRPTFKSAYPDPQILPQCNISSNYPL